MSMFKSPTGPEKTLAATAPQSDTAMPQSPSLSGTSGVPSNTLGFTDQMAPTMARQNNQLLPQSAGPLAPNAMLQAGNNASIIQALLQGANQ